MKPEENNGFDKEEGRQNPVLMLAVGAALVAVIVLLCVLIWKVSHAGNDPDGSGPEKNDRHTSQSSTESVSDTVPVTQETPAETDETGENETTGGIGNGAEENPAGSTGQPQDSSAMTFAEVDETVTAKEVTNLRSEPSTSKAETVVTQLTNGQTARRTGINEDSGWSRLEYNGQVLYAASSLLTTDLSAGPPAGEQSGDTVTTADGRVITFTPCDDTIMPKIEVNLRSEPSTSKGNETVYCLVKYGESIHRTGYDAAMGWSRVEYDGQVLYVVTSYTFIVEDTLQEE